MRVLCRTTGKTLLDKDRSDNIRPRNVQNVNEWLLRTKKECNEHGTTEEWSEFQVTNHHRVAGV